MTRYIDHKETNKILRAALKDAFPGVKFSVRKSGGSTYVSWTDGPTAKQVNAVTDCFEGAGFDPMTDYKYYISQEYKGETVKFGVDYILTSREVTEEYRSEVIAAYNSLPVQEQCDIVNSLTARSSYTSEEDAIVCGWQYQKAA